MGIWKDSNNALYDDMCGEAIKLPGWPKELTKITDAEAQAIRLAAESAPAPAVPQSVTPWGIRKALNQLGLRDAVESAVASSDDYNLKDGWQYAIEFRRDDPLVAQLATALGKTDDELDALFALAAAL